MIHYFKVLAYITSSVLSVHTSAALPPPLAGTGGSCSLVHSGLFANKGFSGVCQAFHLSLTTEHFHIHGIHTRETDGGITCFKDLDKMARSFRVNALFYLLVSLYNVTVMIRKFVQYISNVCYHLLH